MKRLSALFYLFCLFVFFTACKKDAATAPDMGYNYFPGQVGSFVVYDVDSVYYDSFTGTADTAKFRLKEKIESVFSDNQGRPSLRLERSRKYYNDTLDYSLQNWQLTDVWMATKTATDLEKVEENIRYVKLVFPLRKDKTWEGNSTNTLPATTYHCAFVDQKRYIGAFLLDSVSQIVQQDESNLITRNYSEEKYARNIGLVYKQTIAVESQPPASWSGQPFEADSLAAFYAKPILQRVSSGYQFTYTYQSSGTE